MFRCTLQASLLLGLLFGTSACRPPDSQADSEGTITEAAWISLTVTNGLPAGPLDLIAGREYVFDRITLAVDNPTATNSREALDWLRRRSVFRDLDWRGVRETRAYWRNYRESRPAADLYAHVFAGARWMREPNSFQLSVLDARGDVLSGPLHLTHRDFLNHVKQQDYDMIKAEYRYENFARHKQLGSARARRAVAKIVLAVQTDLTKRLLVPSGSHALRVVWDKEPNQPYIFPIRLVPRTYGYGGQLEVTLEPDKAVFDPGDTIRATFTLRDQDGQVLKFSDSTGNGIRQFIMHLDGPVQDPTYYHEEWLSEFDRRYTYHLRAPALGLGTATESLSTDLQKPPLGPSGDEIVVDVHVPKDLPREKFGTFEIGATIRRQYASQQWTGRLDRPVQVGQQETTRFEAFDCVTCHVPDTPTDVGLLIPPMAGIEKLAVDSIESCVMCHDNSRNGSRRLGKYLHLIHMNREGFPAKNDCRVCHLTATSIRKVSFEACSACHEGLHQGNEPRYTDAQCEDCHRDYGRGHVAPALAVSR